MAKNILFEASPINPATGLAVTVRMSMSGGEASTVLLNGFEWLPCIQEGPTREITVFSESSLQTTEISHGDVSFRIHSDFGNVAWSTYNWTSALGRIWVGDRGAAWASYTQVFEGSCGPIVRSGAIAKVALLGPETVLDRDLLTILYAGTGSEEGLPNLKGVPKPICYGDCSNLEAVLIDPAYFIYQYHGYGATNDVVMVYENAYQVNATSSGTYTTYAALKAATLVEGQWAKAPAVGMFRLGGEPRGKVTADVQGAKIAGTYSNRLSKIVPDIMQVSGLSGAYIDTTSFSNFDPSHTNLLTYSEQFDHANWTKSFATVTANAAVAPDGTTTADKLIPNASANRHFAYQSALATGASVVSVYAKPAGRNYVTIGLTNTSGFWTGAQFNVSTGALVGSTFSLAGLAFPTSTRIESVGSGWYRCSVVIPASVAAAGCSSPFVMTSNGGDPVFEAYTGDAVNGIYVWGAQLETAAALTSYIQTTTAAVTAGTYTWSYYSREQANIGDVARDALAQAGGYIIPSSTGVFKVGNFYGTRTAVALNGNRSTAPMVRNYQQLASSPPNYKVKIGCDRAWSVNSDGEISLALLNAGLTADAATAAAAAAQADADLAQADATTALAQLSDLSADSILDRSEKAILVQRFTQYTAEKTGIDTRASALAITTEKTAYDTAYTAWQTYLTGLSPAYTDTTQNTTIVRTTFDTKANDFLTAKTVLMNKMYEVAATVAVWANVIGAPTTLAGLDAAAAAELDGLSNDNKLTPIEKNSLAKIYTDLDSRYNLVLSRATTLGLSSTAMTTARTNWTTLLGTYSPAWNDTTQETNIYTHWFADQSFPTGWTTTVSTSASGGYTTVTDGTSSYLFATRNKAQTGVNQYTIGLIVKKDSTGKATRFALLRAACIGGSTYDVSFDTSTGEALSTQTAMDAAGSFDLGADWLIYGTFTTGSGVTSVNLDLYPAVGQGSTLSAANYNPATTGSVVIKPPLIAQGTLNALGRAALSARTKVYTNEIETLAAFVSSQDASLALWSGVSGTGRPQDYATQSGVGPNMLLDDTFLTTQWNLTPTATRFARVANDGFPAGYAPYFLEVRPPILGTDATPQWSHNFLSRPNVTVGKRYYGSVYVQKNAAVLSATPIVVAIAFFDSSSTYISAASLNFTAAELTAGAPPKQYQFSGVAPAGAVTASFICFVDAIASAAGHIRFELPNLSEVGSTATVQGTTSKTVAYDYTTTALSGQLPTDLGYSLYVNGAGQTTGVTWTYLVLTGTVNTFDFDSGTKSMTGTGVGTLTLTSVGTDLATVKVTGTQNGLASSLIVTINRSIGAAPVASTTIATGSAGGTTTSSSFADKSGSITGTMPTGKTAASITANLTNQIGGIGSGQNEQVEWKLERNISGTWTQIGSTVTSIARERIVDVETNQWGVTDGNTTISVSDTGLTAGVSYSWRISARRSSGSHTNYLSGTVTVIAP